MQHRVLVTGAAKRLGRAMAQHLAERGFDVAVHYANSKSAAQELVDDIQDKGGNAVALQADLLCEDQAQNLVSRASAELGGPLNCLINNASIFEFDDLASSTRENWDRHMGSNLRAPFVLTQQFAAQIPRCKYDGNREPVANGLIVNMIDQRVRRPNPEFISYSIAKMGLWTLTKMAAQALSPQIRVNAIGPGPTLQGAHQTEGDFLMERQTTLLRRGANPEDIIGALNYFLDSPSVTGQLICVDAGQHLEWRGRMPSHPVSNRMALQPIRE